MDTEESNISKVVKLFLANRYSSILERHIQHWLLEDSDNPEKVQGGLEYWNSLAIEPDAEAYEAAKKIIKVLDARDNKKTKPLLHYALRVAAVLLPLFILAGGYLYYTPNRPETMLETTTAYGQKKQITLLDGSQITLMAGSKIKYPKRFDGDTRTVILNGEAYFSVEKDPNKPFVVKTSHMDVRVLGTKFTVKSYNEDTKALTTLYSGKVEVVAQNGDRYILKPHQQFRYNLQNYKQEVIDMDNKYTSENEPNQLDFVIADLAEIMQTLQRRFNISVDADSSILKKNDYYTIKFSEKDSLESILSVLETFSTGVLMKKQGGKIVIRKG